MEFVTGWVQNIAYYMIFMTVVLSLLPAKQYEKYVRFFAGIILILLVIKPFLGGLRLEDEISHFYQEFSLKQDTAELEQKILGVEQQQKKMILAQYEAAVREDIRQMADSSGFSVRELEVSVCEEEGEDGFGKVERVRLLLRYVGMGMGNGQEMRAGQGMGMDVQTGGSPKRAEEGNRAANQLRERIAQYYRLEVSYVEIQLEEG
ncbi:MAG: stage III sporulation protein AF [bacterium]|nr:stage III sporulation protein AF [bacterium]